MRKLLAYILVLLSGFGVFAIGAIFLTLLGIGGNYPMMIVTGCAIGTGIGIYRNLEKIFNRPTSKELRKYPVRSKEFPFEVLFIDDIVCLSDGRSYRYTGNFAGKYGFEGSKYVELSKDEIMNDVVELSNSRILKWKRPN